MKGRRDITPARRLVAALGLSIACHAGLLVARSGDAPISVDSPQPGPPAAGAITVAVLERGESAVSAPGAWAVMPAAPVVSSDAPTRAAPAAGTTAASASPVVRGRRSRAAGKADLGAPGAAAAASTGTPPERALAVPTDRAVPAEPSDRGRESAREDAGAAGGSADAAAAGGTIERTDAAGANEDVLVAAAGPHAAGVGAGTAGDGGGLRAWCRSCPTPEYPVRARRQGWQGTVDVDLHVDRDGVVEHASVGRSSGFALLDAAAVTVARRSRFWVSSGGDGLRGQLRYRFVLEEARSHRPL